MGIYIHIPFCKQACHYCDFHFSTSLQRKSDFVNALVKEISLRKNYLPATAAIDTIYFGGGTPSLLEESELMLIFDALNKHFNINPSAEITLEANPDDLTPEKIRMLAQSPVNRLSIGIQSFDDAELQWMNRAHQAAQGTEAVKMSQDGGFSNISVDLIYGSPLLSIEQWEQHLLQVFALQVPHLSAYNLTVEKNTPLAHMIKRGISQGPGEAASASQFSMLMELTALHGFEHYEISNFAKAGMYSRHNSSYWNGQPYLGLGPSAHSYDLISRQWNISNNNTYIRDIMNGTLNFTHEVLTPADAYNEYVMVSLRTSRGADVAVISERWGSGYAIYFEKMAAAFLNEQLLIRQGTSHVLSTKGKLLADRIASDMFYISKDPVSS